MSKAGLAVRALRLALARSHADPIPDYDAASPDYDTYFSPVMGVHSIVALDEVEVRPGSDVLELACGTGHLTAQIVSRLRGRGSVQAVDKSPGMLSVARAKVDRLLREDQELRVSLEVGDMSEFLAARPAASADLVVIGWAICYGKPVKLLEQVNRVLRPGGHIVVIETRGDALKVLVDQMEKMLATDPSLLTSLIRVNLPKNAAVVARWFTKAGLTVEVAREGEQVLPARTPEEAWEWVERSGAAAGFKDAVDQNRETEVRALLQRNLERYVAQHGALELRHSFVVVTGVKPGGGATDAGTSEARRTKAGTV
jgi:ubiquinone/menaquinone biosynthesis C-methylase UbiE